MLVFKLQVLSVICQYVKKVEKVLSQTFSKPWANIIKYLERCLRPGSKDIWTRPSCVTVPFALVSRFFGHTQIKHLAPCLAMFYDRRDQQWNAVTLHRPAISQHVLIREQQTGPYARGKQVTWHSQGILCELIWKIIFRAPGPQEKERGSWESGNGRPGNCSVWVQVVEWSVLQVTRRTKAARASSPVTCGVVVFTVWTWAGR